MDQEDLAPDLAPSSVLRPAQGAFSMRIFEMRASIFVLVSSLSAETAMPIRRVGPVPKARWKSVVRLTRSRCLSGAGGSQNQASAELI
jgi:hypothetical protein